MKNNLKKALVFLRNFLSRDVGWKIASVIFAVMLWSYVVTSNTSITRDVTLTGVETVLSGQSVLEGRGLALLTDIVNDMPEVLVRVTVSQASYARVRPETVRVELDLSGIRQTGKQTVTLRGTTAYGQIAQITPSSIELDVEELDQRYVPVNVELTGEKNENYWYNTSRVNPTVITVSGPSSLVQTLASARVRLDVTGVTDSHNRAMLFDLIDSSGETVATALTKSSASVNVSLDVYPTKKLSVSNDIATTTTGELPEGYQITGIELSPNQITVAGEQTLLDSFDDLEIEPVKVSGAKQSFTAVSNVQNLRSFKYASAEQISVTVYIEETELVGRYQNVVLAVTGKAKDVNLKLSDLAVDVKVTGPYSVVSALEASDLIATVDVSELEAGSYEVPISLSVDNHPELTFETTPSVVRVTVLE